MPSARGQNGPSDTPNALLGGIRPEWIRFADEDARRLAEQVLAADGAGADWQLVKRTALRSVYRARTDGHGVLYFKHFHAPTIRHRLRRRLGRSDALRELRYSRLLSAGQVPACSVLAACCRDGQEWLVSKGIEPGQPADLWHAEQARAGNHQAIRQATVTLARLVGRMHAQGVVHRDLRGGNVLVRPGENGPELVLMGLRRMSRRWRLSRAARAADLARLLNDRLLVTSRSARIRFLRHYLEASGAGGSVRGWVRRIEPLAERRDRRLHAQRARRVFGDNRHFVPLSVNGYQAHVVLLSGRQVPGSRASVLELNARDWQAALADPEALFAGPDVQVIKDDVSSLVVRRTLRVGPAELDVYVKRARRNKACRAVLDVFRLSRAMRAFKLGHALLDRRIHTALPLAALEKRVAGVLVDSILITEAVGQSLHVNKFLSRHLGAQPGADERAAQASGQCERVPAEDRRRLARHVLWQLGRLVRRLHQEGFAHRDLKASNLLVRWDGQPGSLPEIVMVDLDGLSQVGHVSRRRQFRGLMRLNVSLLECPSVTHVWRLRMLLGYLRQSTGGPVNFKPYWRVLQVWSNRKIRRQIASRQRQQKVQRRSEQ